LKEELYSISGGGSSSDLSFIIDCISIFSLNAPAIFGPSITGLNGI
jgi:hypothetical protein